MKFEVKTPLGFVLRATEEYWQKLLVKHPDLADRGTGISSLATS